MHLILMFIALTVALWLRFIPLKTKGNLGKRWQYSLFLFSFPPLIILMTCFAVIFMGYNGQMLGFPASKVSYIISLFFIFFSLISLLKLSYQSWLSIKKIRTYPLELVQKKSVRILDISFPYSGQIGFWNSELVISHELINLLSPQHLKAVIAHEEAHYNYRDTFWFFWLSFLKIITFWLPNTETLWRELLLLRELRADQKASEKVDSLLLAESLLFVTQASVNSPLNFSESFSCAFSNNRLSERVEALLNPEKTQPREQFNLYSWIWFFLALSPWLTIPFHS